MTSLKLAAMRGVDVRILAPDQIDHTIVWLAAFSYFDELLAVGAQIWRFDDGFMHQKVLVVDRRIASVGATNLENRSRRLDFDVTAVFFDDGAADNLALMLEGDFARPQRMTRKLSGAPARIRYGVPVARLFAPPL
jgi:cardiolipin synthase